MSVFLLRNPQCAHSSQHSELFEDKEERENRKEEMHRNLFRALCEILYSFCMAQAFPSCHIYHFLLPIITCFLWEPEGTVSMPTSTLLAAL